jgi:hypothetical protein
MAGRGAHHSGMDGVGPAVGIVFALVLWSSVIGVLVGRLDWWEAVPGASPWRIWGPVVLAWSWPVALTVGVIGLAHDAWWGVPTLLMVPLTLSAATVLLGLELQRRRAEDRTAGLPRRVKL